MKKNENEVINENEDENENGLRRYWVCDVINVERSETILTSKTF